MAEFSFPVRVADGKPGVGFDYQNAYHDARHDHRADGAGYTKH